MSDLLDNPAVQAGVVPFVVALLMALPLARTRFLVIATGSATIDKTVKAGSLEVRIPGDAKRADGKRSRDEHLKAADFFNVAEYPEMTYRSRKFNFAGDRIESVEGTLTLLGVSKPVKLQALNVVCKPNPMSKKDMCGGDFSGTLTRSDFGMKFGIPGISDEVKLAIAVEAYKD
jgi:polyisoprenoid-binding protein YceI